VVYTSHDIPTEKDPKSQWSVIIELVNNIKKISLFIYLLESVPGRTNSMTKA
jgi:hypothetical protein